MRRLTAEEKELGNKEWANFGQYNAAFGDDPSLYEGLDEAGGNNRPAAGACIASLVSRSDPLSLLPRRSAELAMIYT